MKKQALFLTHAAQVGIIVSGGVSSRSMQNGVRMGNGYIRICYGASMACQPMSQ